MLVKLIRFIKGYVIFSLTGRYPERFINLLNRNGISCRELLPGKEKYIGQMSASDYLKIRKTARKSSVRLRVEKKAGLPFLIKKYKVRKGIAAGAVLAVIILSLLSMFVWDVKLNGAEKLSESSIHSVLESSGLKPGAFKPSVDFEAAERELQLKLPQIRWVSINALNSIAEVEIKEKFKKPALKKGKSPCNLTASEDGVITDTVISAGTCMVKRGTAVSENQLLVSTVVEGTNELQDKLSYVHCEGKIYADVIKKRTFSLDKKIKVIFPDRNYTEKSSLKFLWADFLIKPASPNVEFNCPVFHKKRLSFNEVKLPLGINCIDIYGFKKFDKLNNKILLKKKAFLSEAFILGKYTIKRKKYSFKEIKDRIILDSTYIVNKNIAVKRRVNVE